MTRVEGRTSDHLKEKLFFSILNSLKKFKNTLLNHNASLFYNFILKTKVLIQFHAKRFFLKIGVIIIIFQDTFYYNKRRKRINHKCPIKTQINATVHKTTCPFSSERLKFNFNII